MLSQLAAWGIDMKLAAILILAAALCFGFAVSGAYAQPPVKSAQVVAFWPTGSSPLASKEVLTVNCATGKITLHGKPWNRDPEMVKVLLLIAQCQGAR